MINQRMRLKTTLVLCVIAIIGIFLVAGGTGNICGEVHKDNNLEQKNNQAIENLESKKNAEIKEQGEEDKVLQEKKTKEKGNIQAVEEQKKRENPGAEEGKVTEEKAKEKGKILKVEYANGLLSLELQNVDIIEVLKKIAVVANVEIDVGPGVKEKIENIKFKNLSWEKAMEKLIEGEGSGVVVEYEKGVVKRIMLSKNIEEIKDKALTKKDEIIDLTLRRRFLSGRVQGLNNIYSKIVLFNTSNYQKEYIRKFGKAPNFFGDTLLFFSDKGNLIKELPLKEEESVFVKNDKKYRRTKIINAVFSNTGKYVLVVENQCDKNALEQEDFYTYNRKAESFFYSYNGDLLFKKKFEDIDASYSTVSESGNYVTLSSNAIFNLPPGKSFFSIYNKYGNELYKLNVGFLTSDAPLFLSNERYVLTKIIGMPDDSDKERKRYLVAIDIRNKKFWKHEYRASFSRVNEHKNKKLVMIKDGNYIYEYTYDGILMKIRKFR